MVPIARSDPITTALLLLLLLALLVAPAAQSAPGPGPGPEPSTPLTGDDPLQLLCFALEPATHTQETTRVDLHLGTVTLEEGTIYLEGEPIPSPAGPGKVVQNIVAFVLSLDPDDPPVVQFELQTSSEPLHPGQRLTIIIDLPACIE